MDRSKKIVLSFLNSAEGYFHTKRVIEDQVKQPRNLYGPKSDRPERWDYKDIRDISIEDLNKIISESLNILDKDLFKQIPSTAIHAALQTTIHSLENGKFQSKMDSNTYNTLYVALEKKIIGNKGK